MIDNKYYIYIYLNPLKEGVFKYKNFIFEHEPFYIGMGKGNRMESHAINTNKKTKDVDRLVIEILNQGKEPIRFKLYENITVESAKRLEKSLIKLIGRKNLNKGPLTNLTNGAEGFIGFHDNKWTLISPNKEEYTFESSIRKNLRKFGFEYSVFKIKNGIGTFNGWTLKIKNNN
jgi:hypothetical protein